MKKAMFLILVLVLALSSIAAVPNHGVVLISVTNNAGGPMFTFRVDGTGSLKALVHSINGEYKGDYSITCKQVDKTTVTCHAPKKLSGSYVTIDFRETKTWVLIPDQETQFCYDIYATNNAYLSPKNQVRTLEQWVKVGSHCQGSEANVNDQLTFGFDVFTFRTDLSAGPAYYLLPR